MYIHMYMLFYTYYTRCMYIRTYIHILCILFTNLACWHLDVNSLYDDGVSVYQNVNVNDGACGSESGNESGNGNGNGYTVLHEHVHVHH